VEWKRTWRQHLGHPPIKEKQVNTFKKFLLAAGLCAAGMFGAQTATAQSTDGFHTIQVFPVVVDSGSFTQKFTFRNPNSATVNIAMYYFPGGGPQTVGGLCNSYAVNANSDRTFDTLRSICPGLAAGSNFGFLWTYETDAANLPYSGFSRVANPQGNGFAVEAFAASEFTSADATVPGLRRSAATISAPSFQTNCFVGVMPDYTGPVTGTVPVDITVYSSANAVLGSTTTLNIVPGTVTRLLDVFAAVGAPAGDHINARMDLFENYGPGEPGIFSFCTVQDNTSFGADFRIGKQEQGFGGESSGPIGPQSDYDTRVSSRTSDITSSGFAFGSLPATRTFEIAAVNGSANTHVIYFHHPDWVQCEIIDPNTGVRALNGYGLEMRLLDNTGTPVTLAGGDGIQGFGEIYLGDKIDYNTGSNGRYTIEVENNGFNTASTRPYRLKCQSGSGHTLGELIKYKEATDRF
jgi:hypothetical protein